MDPPGRRPSDSSRTRPQGKRQYPLAVIGHVTQELARLEDAKLGEGWYEQRIVDGQIIRESHYKLTGAGRKAWESSRVFFERAIKALLERASLTHR